jgi:hypothetical protein
VPKLPQSIDDLKDFPDKNSHKKSRRTKEDLKDKEIEILKLKYDTKKIEMMDYLMLISEYVQDFE